MAIVVFDPAAWKVRYPQFAAVTDQLATMYFVEAQLYCANDSCALVPYDPMCNPPIITRAQLLNMLTAHIAALNAPQPGGGGPSPIVGRVSNATQGSVSVAAQNDYPAGTVQWYQQTPYGSAFWAAAAPFRTARYRELQSGYGPGGPFGGGVLGAGGRRLW